MSIWPEFERYSKRSVFLSVPDDIEVSLWANQAIHHLGGVKGTNNEGEGGWVVPKNQEENFHKQYRLFKENGLGSTHRARRSKSPNTKRKRSRVFVRASGIKNELSNSETVYLEDSKNDSSNPISYINWEKSADHPDKNLEDEKSNSPRLEEDEVDDADNIDNEEHDSDEESSDDEMIQAVLARKMKSESSGKIIDAEKIDDSDEEDCVSHSRRFRHLYAIIENLRSRVVELETSKK